MWGKKHSLWETTERPYRKNVIQYKNYKNVLYRYLKEAEDSYYLGKISDKQNGIIFFWKSFGKTINNKKNKSNHRLQKLFINGHEITDDVEIANELNNYFSEIGEKLSSNIRPTGIDFTSYLKKKINEKFFLAPVMEQEVRGELSILNHKKSPGPDSIPAKLIKEWATQFSTPLTLLYNKSITLAKYPGQWKLARVTASYKKKNRSLAENYRPISLLNIFGKIFEKLVYIQMMNFIDKRKIFFVYQYGIKKKHSTSLALIDIVDKMKFALDKNEYALGILLDITKTFDSINHDILITKLENYGFHGHSSVLLRSSLSGRIQFTSLQSCTSDMRTISYGVPQGSILGPLLFLLYINYIQYVSHEIYLRLFADDTAIFLHQRDPNILIHQGKLTIKQIMTWFETSKLSLSIGKSNFILFHGRHKNTQNQFTAINIGDESILRTYSGRYIGLTLDENLSWDTHIDDVCNNLIKYFSIFYNIRNVVTSHVVRAIYFACIHSRIKYGIETYGSASEYKISKLQILQNKLLKLLIKKERRYSTNKLHKASISWKSNRFTKHRFLCLSMGVSGTRPLPHLRIILIFEVMVIITTS